MITLYGIPNCDTVRKARKWLDANGIEFDFHDFRKNGLDEKQLKRWVKELGWEVLLNKRGMMWRKLPDNQKENIDEKKAIAIMLAEPVIFYNYKNKTQRLWGRNGFDGDIQAYCCMPSFCLLVKRRNFIIIADDYNYALAA